MKGGFLRDDATGALVVAGGGPGDLSAYTGNIGASGSLKSFRGAGTEIRLDNSNGQPTIVLGLAADVQLTRSSGAIFDVTTKSVRISTDDNTVNAIGLRGGFSSDRVNINTTPYMEMLEAAADPANPAAGNWGRFYMRDNGSGKTQFCVRFNTGAPIVLATEA